MSTSASTPSLPRLVVCAAIRHAEFPNILVLGARHYDPLMRSAIDAHINACHDGGDRQREIAAWRGGTQGFIDQRGVFLTRTEAWAVASAAGQIRRRGVGGETADGGTLYSEHLY